MKNLKFILLLSIASLARTQELNESDGGMYFIKIFFS